MENLKTASAPGSHRWRSFLLMVSTISWTSVTLAADLLPHDPRTLAGQCDNGVRWLFRKHDNPPGKLSIMMHVRTGSLNELDSQRGLAHFMEHMVFNGTEHFKPGELIPYFESIGMKFGADLNAGTSFDRTSYMIHLPNTDPPQIDKALMVLSDFAFQASLADEEIDKERPVILEEARGRKNAEQRIRDKLWPELFAGSRLAQRLPIGIEEVIASAPPSEFLDYYHTWYRPENVTVLMVGDTAFEPIQPLIEKWFCPVKTRKPGRTPLKAELRPFPRERAFVITDPEVTIGSVQLLALLPGRGPAVTEELWRKERVEELAGWLLSRRCDEMVKKGEASFRQVGANVSDMFHEAMTVMAAVRGEPGDWARMLEQLVCEVSRANEYGFTEKELELVKREIVAQAERGVRTEPTENGRSMLSAMLNAVNDGVPIMSAQQRLDLIRKLLPSVKAGEVSRVFKECFAPGGFAYTVVLPEKETIKAPSRDDVLAAARASWARKVEPRRTEEIPDAILATLPVPGSVAESTEDKDLGVTHAWLSNGVRVHHRFMDYKKDSVTVTMSLAGGGIEEIRANLGVTSVAALAISNPATGRLSSTAVRDLMLGKNISVGGGANADDAFVVRVSGSPKDLESGLQLAYALLIDGKIEETAFKNWKLETLRQLEEAKTNVAFQAGEAMSDLLSGGDPRRMTVKKENVEALSMAQGQAWFKRLCQEAPIEVAVVGDVTWEQARPLVERYIGSLGPRKRGVEHLDKLRTLARSRGPLNRRVDVATVTPSAVAYSGFVACDGQNVDDRRAMQVAANILSSRLIKTVREELGLVYSIGASFSPSWIYRDTGSFQAGSKCKPANAERVAEEVHKLFARFAESGPRPEELENARKQVLNTLDISMKEPSYWVELLEHLDHRGRSLDEPKTVKAAIESMIAEEIQATFRKYFTPARAFTVTAIPVAPASVPAQPADAKEKTPAGTP